MPHPINNDILAVIRIMQIVVETIRETGKKGAPSGVVYLGLHTMGCNFASYNRMISELKNLGIIQEQNNLLYTALGNQINIMFDEFNKDQTGFSAESIL